MSNFNSLFQMADEFNNLIGALTKPAFDFPRYNISKTADGKFAVDMALAGYDKSELSVKVSQGVVEISGTPAIEKLAKTDNIMFKGIAMKPFKVRMALPYGVPVGNVKFDNGILSFEFGDKAAETKELTIN